MFRFLINDWTKISINLSLLLKPIRQCYDSDMTVRWHVLFQIIIRFNIDVNNSRSMWFVFTKFGGQIRKTLAQRTGKADPIQNY